MYMQIHLFDIDIPGKQTFKESDTLSPGKTITVVDTSIGRLGIGICYDIRFPELAMLYAKRGVQLIVYPGGKLCTNNCKAMKLSFLYEDGSCCCMLQLCRGMTCQHL